RLREARRWRDRPAARRAGAHLPQQGFPRQHGAPLPGRARVAADRAAPGLLPTHRTIRRVLHARGQGGREPRRHRARRGHGAVRSHHGGPMNRRANIGFDRRIDLEWLDAAAAQAAAGAPTDEMHAYLWSLLDGAVSGDKFNSARGKTVTVLNHIWGEVPGPAASLRERA